VVLPDAVTPDRYRIDFTPDSRGLVFKGSVAIDVTVHAATRRVVLNCADLVIDRAALAATPTTARVSYDVDAQTATLDFGRELPPGAATLLLDYHGKIYLQASGLFAVDYASPRGPQRALYTQFENSDARRFVPSWDEPGAKAVFELTATVPAAQMAVSNMPVAEVEPLPGGLQRVRFAPTPKMSSYLLFFGAGDFERAHRDVNGVDVGVIVKRGDLGQAGFALDTAAQILPYYDDYFDVPYPLPKLDLIAAPSTSQFFSAMENWGAIFYFERDLLIDPRVSTQGDRQNVYVTIAHEMAHQWFGDLVTMAWWDDLWLNEGFASWMENKVGDRFHPEWRLWLQFLGTKQQVMQEDARDGTHAIITPIADVQQASGAFDDITYDKGAAVIRMLESYVGEAAFRAGVRRYIRAHAYGNTVTDDLWRAMDAQSDHPITQIAHDFTLQAGVPMLSETASQCTSGKDLLTVVQGRYAIDPDSTTARTWHVPASLAAAGGASGAGAAAAAGPAPLLAVISTADPLATALANCGPVVLNDGQTSYFRSRYLPQSLALLTQNFAALSAENQLGLFDDTAALAYVGDAPMAAILDMTRDFPADADPVVATALVSWLVELDHIYDGLPAQALFRTFARGVTNRIFVGTGWDARPGEADNISILRSAIIPALARFGDAELLAQAHERFRRYLEAPDSLSSGTRRAMLRAVAASADPKVFAELHELARSSRTEVERMEFYDLLASTQNDALAGRALEVAMSGETPTTTAPAMISRVSVLHPAMAFDFAVANWQRLSGKIEPSTQASYVPQLLSQASDPALIGKLDRFAARYIPADARQDVRRAVARIRYFAEIRRRRLPEVDAWLRGAAPAQPTAQTTQAHPDRSRRGLSPRARRNADRRSPVRVPAGTGRLVHGSTTARSAMNCCIRGCVSWRAVKTTIVKSLARTRNEIFWVAAMRLSRATSAAKYAVCPTGSMGG
jgi:aminopeptidase N